MVGQQEQFVDRSEKTAMRRRAISVPVRYLRLKELLVGRVLDYGCGRGFDADALKIERYDPHYAPKMPGGKFDTIVCNYVLNVVRPEQVDEIVKDIRGRLRSGGVAYFNVRRDIKREGVTKSGTFQNDVKLDLPVEIEKSGRFAIYRMKK